MVPLNLSSPLPHPAAILPLSSLVLAAKPEPPRAEALATEVLLERRSQVARPEQVLSVASLEVLLAKKDPALFQVQDN